MGSNPINLFFRFILELAALVVYGWWGWNVTVSFLKYGLGVAIPLVAAIVWGTFAVLDDPSRSGKAPVPVSGIARLILELAFFALAAIMLFYGGNEILALILIGAVILHYALSYDRIIWLIHQKVKSS